MRVAIAIAVTACVACVGGDSEDRLTATSSESITVEDVVLYASTAPVRVGWQPVSDNSAAGGARLYDPNLGAAKIATPLASPSAYFEMTFYASAGKPYHLWLRMRADSDAFDNDSVSVQFSDSVTSSGAATDRIGTTSGEAVVLEDCDGAGRRGWGWNDNGWCGMGSSIYFATSGQHTIRVQQREDGVSIDQIVLSPGTYLSTSPGALENDTTELAAQSGGPPKAGTSFKALTWNTAGPLGSAAIDLVSSHDPQVVFLQEVDSPTLVENLRVKLQSVQGGTWQKQVISRGTDTSSSYVAIVSKFPLSNVGKVILRQPGTYVIPCYSSSAVFWPGRAAIGATTNVGGRTLSLFGVRMTSPGNMDCVRAEEAHTLKSFAANYPAVRIYGGDFNSQPSSSEPAYQVMLGAPLPASDSWAVAVANHTAIAYNGSPSLTTPTLGTRIDWVLFDQGTPDLTVRSSEIADVNGLSDHRMMMTTFDVQ